MNWMTSGRKRVQRSQKAKELRAKHFAKVAADRARAPVPQPIRAERSSAIRQSADVSRLKSRWNQQPAAGQAGAAAGQYSVPGSSTGHVVAEAGVGATSPASTVPTNDGEFQAGLLELDVTPPFNISSRQQQQHHQQHQHQHQHPQQQQQQRRRQRCFTSGGRGATADGGYPGDYGDGIFQRPAKQPRRQEPAPALPHAEPEALSPRFAQNVGVERRQLVFGGRDSGADHSECGDGYDSQPLGDEDDSTGVVGVRRSSRALAPWERCGQERGHPMRFFNAGVEVAHDGSPAPSAVAAPSPLRPAPPLAPSFAGQLDGGNNDIGATTASGVNPSGDAGGLPMFSMAPLARGRNRPPAAPPEELGAENAPPSVCIERHAQRSSDGRHQPERSSPAQSFEAHDAGVGEESNVHRQEKEGEGEGSRDPSRDPAEFAVLARTWGLFDGALDSPQDSTAAAHPAPPAPSTSYSDGQGKTAAERAGNGVELASWLHAAVSVRGTPPLRGLGNDPPGEVNPGEREPRPRSQALGADYYNPRDGGSGSGGSPELTMLFVDEPEGKGSKAFGAGKGGAEALHGEPRDSDGARDLVDQRASPASLTQGIASGSEDHVRQKQNTEQQEASKPNVGADTNTAPGDGNLTDTVPQPSLEPVNELDEAVAAAAAVDAAGTKTPGSDRGDVAAADTSLLPYFSRTSPQPPTTAARASPPQNAAATPSPSPSSTQGGGRKRRAGGGKEAPGQQHRRRIFGGEPTPVAVDGGEGNSRAVDAQQNPKTGRPLVPPVAGSSGGSGGAGSGRAGRVGGGGVGGAGQHPAALAVHATAVGQEVGEEGIWGFGRSGEEGDAQSAVVWYRTIVACLMAAAS